MAVTVDVLQLANALRVSDTTQETEIVTRLLAVGTEIVTRYAPNAPDSTANEAVVRVASYLFDQPNAGRGVNHANAFRNSGAQSLLAPYRAQRIGAAVQAAIDAGGSPGNPVTNIDVTGTTLTVTFADGSTRAETLPAGGGGGVDQTARDQAAAAQAAADGKLSESDVNPFALETPHAPILPADLVPENQVPDAPDLIPVTTNNGRNFRMVESATISGTTPATESAAGIVKGADAADAGSLSGTAILRVVEKPLANLAFR